MAIDLNDEILQDFLLEAGEILEQLGEQLVELEHAPDNYDLLNAIFRGFHTVKGGAGFLNLSALVEVCHKAEDVFNSLRQGEQRVTPDLMDVVLQVLDIVNRMFDEVRQGEDPTPAESALLQRLRAYTDAGYSAPAPPPAPAAPVAPPVAVPAPPAPAALLDESEEDAMTAMLAAMEEEADFDQALSDSGLLSDDDLISEDEFEALLDELHGHKAPSLAHSPAGDEISEAEFEALLDQLHGHGKGPNGTIPPGGKSKAKGKKTTAKSAAKAAPAPRAASSDDEITEDEFDALLDELHGSGKSPAGFAHVTNSGEITEDEFDALLDKLHGKGQFGAAAAPVNVVAAPAPAPVPEPPAIDPTPAAASESAIRPATPRRPAANAAAEGSEGGKPASKPAAANAAETTVRVDTQRLDEIMNMVGELVLVRNRLQTLKSHLNDEQISKAVEHLDVVTSDLQLAVMKTRMQPIKKVFGRFPRVVRDLARSLHKEVNLELRGEETDLDKNLVEALSDPLVHLVRNAVDHGVEMPDERVASGKPREGKVILTASQEGNHIQLTIEDDGKGMNAEVLRRKAVEKGLMDEESASRLDARECYNLIFMPGFSTKSEISDISGRGVGMDVVKTRIAQMNGTVEIDSEVGRGSRIIIKLPLTLAIMPTLMVKLCDQTFALPLSNVVEILDLNLKRTNVVDGQLVAVVRERAMPLFYLGEWLIRGFYPSEDKRRAHGHVVVVNAAGRQVGFVVDHLIGQEEVVIKALGAKLQGVPGLAGATITGDGRIALILDVPGLVKHYAA